MKELDEDDNIVEFLQFRDADELEQEDWSGRAMCEEEHSKTRSRRLSIWLKIAIAVFAAAPLGVILYFVFAPRSNNQTNIMAESAFEPDAITTAQSISRPLRNKISSITENGVTVIDTMVNDIPLRIYVTKGLTPHLEIGYGCLNDTINNVMFFQAADVRADNKQIVGAFVLNGTPLSWGLSKKGFCSIIHDTVTIGVADNSPLFEEATEVGGDFFRQYPLVSNGNLCENELKNKAARRALCEIEGHVAVITTLDSRESLHDFAQALVDIGTVNAIYLVGSTAKGYVQGKDGIIGDWSSKQFKNASFIVWRNK